MRIHAFYDGQSYDVDGADLDVGELSTDQEIKSAVATHFGVPSTKMTNYRVDRVGEDVTLRPQASFGCYN